MDEIANSSIINSPILFKLSYRSAEILIYSNHGRISSAIIVRE